MCFGHPPHTTVWAITAIIAKFPVTLQANAMWKRLIHGSQVLNTLPVEAVPPPPQWSVTPSNFLLCSHQRHPCLGGWGGCRWEGGLWLSGGQTQDVGNKGRVLQTHFIPIHNLCLNSHGIQTAVPNKAQVSLCWFKKIQQPGKGAQREANCILTKCFLELCSLQLEKKEGKKGTPHR